MNNSKYLVFDNYFNNTVNIERRGDPGIFNVSKTFGRNIVGGPYIGGNYWSDYDGEDIDGDFIGDTETPFNGLDFLPLIWTPPIIDNTQMKPINGKNMTFEATAYFPETASEIFVEYWCDLQPHSKANMTITSGDERDGNYTLNLTIPMNATNISYFMGGIDVYDYSYYTSVKELAVIDQFRPQIIDNSSTPTTGDEFFFDFEFVENRLISDYSLEYWFDNGSITVMNQSNFEARLVVPSYAKVLYYIINFSDDSSLMNELYVQKEIIDNDSPTLEVELEDPMTGEKMSIDIQVTDNWDINRSVIIEYHTDDDVFNSTMKLIDDRITFEVTIPVDAQVFRYHFTAFDNSGNAGLEEGNLSVTDIISPVLMDLSGEPTTGDNFTVMVSMEDNIGIDFNSTFLEYRFDSTATERFGFDGESVISIPIDATSIFYRVKTYDVAGNSKKIEVTKAIMDNDLPTFEDVTQQLVEEDRKVTFWIIASDNFEVKDVFIDFWTDGDKTRIKLLKTRDQYSIQVRAPSYGKNLHYIVTVVDSAGNEEAGPETIIKVQKASPVEETNNLGPVAALIIAVAIIVLLLLLRRKRARDDDLEEDVEVPGEEDSEE
jgi:hypothetical protein